ncbi:MAG: mevalonate kinase [Bacteroidota bacterium]
MNKRNPSYNAKLLLFGEYSILLGSSALSIPYSHFRAEFSFIRDDKYTDLKLAKESQQLLKSLLLSYSDSDNFKEILDLPRFKKDLNEGLYLESTIPHSYGLGSSGAVVAAVYSRYSLKKSSANKITVSEMDKLRKLFANMESYFHGTSSGIDPLTIYMSQPLLIDKDKKPLVVGIPRNWEREHTSIFLIDTGECGKTNPLVSFFLEQFAPYGEMNAKARDFVDLTDKCIHNLLNGNTNDFWQSLKALSFFQLNNLQDIIPNKMKTFWKDGLESGNLIMKLCGSGGGGYLTAFAPDHSNAELFIKTKHLKYIPVYIAS